MSAHPPRADIPQAGGVSLYLVEALRAYYVNNPRVIIECSPKPFWHFRSATISSATHGHGGKPDNYAGQLAVEARED